MTSVTLEKTALRVALALARRALTRTCLPGDDAFESPPRAVRRVLVRIQALENALLDRIRCMKRRGCAAA